MGTILTLIGAIILGLIAFTLYACLVVGARADRQMELMMEQESQSQTTEAIQ